MPLFDTAPPIVWEHRPPEFRALFHPLPPDPPAEARRLLEEIRPQRLGEWIGRLKAAGLKADRSTSPDLLQQLRLGLKRPLDTLLCSALDEDPLLRPNAAMSARYPHALSLGVELLGKLCDVRQTLVVMDGDTPRRWSARARHAFARGGARLIPARGDYPQADPTLLLRRWTRRRLRYGHCPAEAGVLLLDAGAAAMAGLCLIHPRIENWPCAIRDHAAGACHYLSVGEGRMMGHVLHEAGIHPAATVLWGGRPLRDRRLGAQAVVDGRQIAFHAAPASPAVHPRACVRCGWCLDACPVNIDPARLLETAQQANPTAARRNDVEACIECGLCTYVCPSQLPLLEGIRAVKKASAHPPAAP